MIICVNKEIVIFFFPEQKDAQDFKEEMDDFAISERPDGLGRRSPEATEAGKRSSAEISPNTAQSTSGKRVKVSCEVSLTLKY